MVKALTPTITMTFPDTLDLDEAAHVYFTMSQGGHAIIEKKDAQLTISDNVVQVWLSQSDTLKLSPGEAEFQLNWTYAPDLAGNVARGGSDIHKIQITKNLKPENLS